MTLLLLNSEFYSPHLGLPLKAPLVVLEKQAMCLSEGWKGGVMLLLCGPGQTPLRVASKEVCC